MNRKSPMNPYERFDAAQPILRDELALDRTRLANERTFLAYIRTAIMLLVSGVSLIKIFPGQFTLELIGMVLIPAGLGAGVLGLVRYAKVRRSLGVLRLQNAGRVGEAVPRCQPEPAESSHN